MIKPPVLRGSVPSEHGLIMTKVMVRFYTT